MLVITLVAKVLYSFACLLVLFIFWMHVISYNRFASQKLVGADHRSGSGGLRPFQWTDKGLSVKKVSVLFFFARIKN